MLLFFNNAFYNKRGIYIHEIFIYSYCKVAYALDVPWYASLPRIETRLYIEQYGGENDIWIGKTLYKYVFLHKFISNQYHLKKCFLLLIEQLDIYRQYLKCKSSS